MPDKFPTQLLVIVDHNGSIVHQSQGDMHLDMMKKYVHKAQDAGDDWSLLQYKLDHVIPCQ